MLYNNPFTSNVDMPASLVARLTKAFDNVRYIKEASMDVAPRLRHRSRRSGGVMNVFAGERIVESFLLGAVGYVNPLRQLHPACVLAHLGLPGAGTPEEAKTGPAHDH